MAETISRQQIEQTIAALEAQRAVLGDAVVDTALSSLREKLNLLAEPAATGEERHWATLLFADIAGFTAFAESMDAEDLQDLMRSFWDQVDQVIERFGGQIDKHFGDGLLAVWGAVTEREDDTLQAVRAALAMHAEASLVCQVHGIEPPLQLRVGLASGLVSISRLSMRDEQNILGDAVNLASRLQGIAPPGGVVINQTAYDQVRGLFDVQPQQAVSLKGRQEAVSAYLVRQEKPRQFHLTSRGLAGLSTRMIGREDELGQLQHAFSRIAAGDGLQWITVTGEPGVGKTRLLLEFEHWLELQPQRIWYLKGRAWPQTQDHPYALLRDLLLFRFDIHENDSLAKSKAKLHDGLSAVLDDALAQEAAAFTGQLIGMDFRSSPWIKNIAHEPTQIRGRAKILFQEYLLRICQTAPAVLFLEDLHWADNASLEMLADIFTSLLQASLCVVGLARPSFWERPAAQAWPSQGSLSENRQAIQLAALPAEQTVALVHELLQKVDPAPDWLVELLVERGEGNPYFTEELVYCLIEQGVILPGTDHWEIHAKRLEELRLPWTIQGVLQSRLDRLAQIERLALQRAAVFGRIFWDEAVNYVGEQAIQSEQWDHLQQTDLIAKRPLSSFPGEEEYQFRHALLRDVVYEYTLKKVRKNYHRRAAEWIEDAAAERANEWASVIAGHYEHAAEWTRAAAWHCRSGSYAMQVNALDVAIESFQKAVAHLPKEPAYAAQRVDALESLCRLLRWRTQYIEAQEAGSQMLHEAEEMGDLAAQSRSWDALAWIRDSLGDVQGSMDAALHAEELARQTGSADELARACFSKGWSHLRSGDLASALDQGLKLVAQCEQEKVQSTLAFALNLVGAAYMEMGKSSASIEYMQRAEQQFHMLGNRRAEGVMRINLGEAKQKLGDYHAALALYQEGVEIFHSLGLTDMVTTTRHNLGWVRVYLQDYDAAETDLQRVIEAAAETKSPHYYLPRTFSMLARACLGQGKIAEALVAARKSLEVSQISEDPEYLGDVWRSLGMVLSNSEGARLAQEQGFTEYDADECYAKSLEIFQNMGAEGEQAHTLREWARYLALQGDQTQAETYWQQARAIFTRLGAELELARMPEQLGA